jgi:2-polyprenyl-3-methyl-5-hydroxy-6-metoxy-1,4-benzoquinol methylase
MYKSEKFWDRIASKFDNSVHKYEPAYRMVFAGARKYLKANDTVLNVGCGTGKEAIEFNNLVKEIQAIDISAKMIEVAKRKTQELDITTITYTQTSIDDEQFQKETYDVILAFNVLHAMKDTPKVMQRLHELLKPGGLMISTTTCMGEQRTLKGFLISLIVFLLSKTSFVPYLRFFKTKELKESVRQGGFQILETNSADESGFPNYFIAAKKP